MFGRAFVMGLCLLTAILPDAALSANAPSAVVAVPATRPLVAAPSQDLPAAPASRTDPSPNRLLIPRIGVNARIEARGLVAHRNTAPPNDFPDAAWYDLGATPEEPGNALISGRVSGCTGSAVFPRLAELRPGDTVIVLRGDGTRLSFKVTSRRTVAAGARLASLFAPSPVATLTLITCTGVWDPSILSDTQRLLVSATLA